MGEATDHGKVLISLADRWPEYATAAEIADETGLSVHKVAALLPNMEVDRRVFRHLKLRRPPHWQATWITFSILRDAGVLREEARRG